jgi:uncharacterized membrane protein
MDKRYRLFVLTLLIVGLALSLISGTDLCNFGGCNETHQYRLFGLPFPAIGVTFFTMGVLLVLLLNRISHAGMLFNLLLAGAGGAEINMILLQKNVIKAWCPVCLGIAAVIYLLLLGTVVNHIIYRKENIFMNAKSACKTLLICVTVLLGFLTTVTAIAKPDSSAGQINVSLGNQNSALSVYVFSDWLCPVCIRVEGVIESVYPTLSRRAKFTFVDKIIHPEAANFVPYHLSFAAHEKDKYLLLRKDLFALAQKTKNPSYDEVMTAIAPRKITYKQLSFLDVTQQMAAFQTLSDQLRVTSTPTMVIRNNKTGKVRVLTGSGEITTALIMKAVQDIE